MMITDAPPRKANHRAGFLESDRSQPSTCHRTDACSRARNPSKRQ
jgi:hypothetical protein